MNAKLGLLICHSDNYFAVEHNIPYLCEKQMQVLTQEAGIELVTYSLVKDERGAKAARAYFESKEIDYLLIVNGAFSTGDIIMEFETFTKPIGVWAVNEPVKNGDIQLNATVSANLFISIAKRKFKHFRNYKWFFGHPEDELFLRRMRVTLKAINAYHAWKHKKVGVLGGVAPTFFNLELDTDVEESSGLQFQHITFDEFIKETKEVEKEQISEMKKIILSSAQDTSRLPEDSLEEGAKVLAALIRMVKKYELSALAACCWPEFQDHFSIVPCVCFTLLAKLTNVPVACEGDIGGAISMLIANSMSDKKPTLMDLAGVEKESLLLWHCGISSCDLQPDQGVSIVPHPMLDRRNPNRKPMGLSYDYAMKPMNVTIMRYSNNHKLFACKARIEERLDGYTGARGYLNHFTSEGKTIAVTDVIETIMANGVEHHIILCPGDLEDSLHEFANMAKIEWMKVETYHDYM